MSMDKYGVVIDPDKEKVAEELTKPMCPRCKRELDSLNPPHCPVCGTEPFEPTKGRSYKEDQAANFRRIYGG